MVIGHNKLDVNNIQKTLIHPRVFIESTRSVRKELAGCSSCWKTLQNIPLYVRAKLDYPNIALFSASKVLTVLSNFSILLRFFNLFQCKSIHLWLFNAIRRFSSITIKSTIPTEIKTLKNNNNNNNHYWNLSSKIYNQKREYSSSSVGRTAAVVGWLTIPNPHAIFILMPRTLPFLLGESPRIWFWECAEKKAEIRFSPWSLFFRNFLQSPFDIHSDEVQVYCRHLIIPFTTPDLGT